MHGKKVLFRDARRATHVSEGISEEVVLTILNSGDTIEEYREDMPYPSRLMFGWDRNRPIHVVIAENDKENETIVITVYGTEISR